MKKITIKKRVWNKRYYPYVQDNTRTQIFYGGASSGKSYFLASRTVSDLLSGERNYLITRKVAKTIRRSVFQEITKIINAWGLRAFFDINKSELTITNIYTRKQMIFCGLDDVEKLKSITPENGVFTDTWIEEATETVQDDVKQLIKRMRGPSTVPKRLILSFNPIYRTHWIFRVYFKWTPAETLPEYRNDTILILHTTYKDNQFLTDDDIAALEDEKDTYFYNVYTLGKWGILGDVIFKNWEQADLSEKYKTEDVFYNGLDFGFSSDPSAMVRCGLDTDRKIIYIYEELNQHGATNDILAGLLSPIISDEPIFCDSAEPKSIQELNNHNIYALPVKKGKDSILHGIQWLQQYKIIVHYECTYTINELQLYQWQKDKDGNSIPKPVDKFNHHIDALRYAFEEFMLMDLDDTLEDYGGIGNGIGAEMFELEEAW